MDAQSIGRDYPCAGNRIIEKRLGREAVYVNIDKERICRCLVGVRSRRDKKPVLTNREGKPPSTSGAATDVTPHHVTSLLLSS